MGSCVNCGKNTSTFKKGKQGKGLLNSAINKLGKLGIEAHYRSPFMGFKKHNFTGPGTNLQKRLMSDGKTPKEWSKPVNKADAAALDHDLCYGTLKTTKQRKQCDNTMIKRLDKIRKNKKNKFSTRGDAFVIGQIMKTKRRIGGCKCKTKPKKK